VFHLAASFAPQWGSALPSLLWTLVLGWLSSARGRNESASLRA